VRFDNKNVFFYFEKRPTHANVGVVVVNLGVEGLEPGQTFLNDNGFPQKAVVFWLIPVLSPEI
jgi:hypothetical protein